jgi:S-adenosylmethionine synthetase
MNVTVTNAHGLAQEDLPVEMVERKGLGHPDTICDRAAEELSRSLSRWYLQHAGLILHHNVDKALLVGGKSHPAFGGGEIEKEMELILCGRATPGVEGGPRAPIQSLVVDGTREWLAQSIPQLTAANLKINSRIGEGSVDLRKVCDANEVPLSNDTSFAVAYAPRSQTEDIVYLVERLLNSEEVKQQWPMLGTDVKVMGVRTDDVIRLTVAVAFIGVHTRSLAHYFAVKDEVREFLLERVRRMTDRDVEVVVNAADGDSPDSIFLTVTGTSAEMGDDGQVGRGNRANGLITPMRPQSLEACAGKNPVNHVGKIYHVMARRIVDRLVSEVGGLTEATCTMVSSIGAPITQPQQVLIEVRGIEEGAARIPAEEITAAVLNDWARIREAIVAGECELF